MWLCLIFFFFSSRRRHTRYIGDWSSDVCSSDWYAEDGAAMQWSLAISPDGGHIYAANPAAGILAVVDAERQQIARTTHFTLGTSTGGLIKSVDAKEVGANAAVVSADGRMLVVAGGSGVAWIDTETLKVTNRALTDWRIWSV